MKIVEIKNDPEAGRLIMPPGAECLLIKDIMPRSNGHMKLLLGVKLKKLFGKHGVIPKWDVLYSPESPEGIILLFTNINTELLAKKDPANFAKSVVGKKLILRLIKSAYKDFVNFYTKLNFSEKDIAESMRKVLQYNDNPDLLIAKPMSQTTKMAS